MDGIIINKIHDRCAHLSLVWGDGRTDRLAGGADGD